MLRSRVRQFGQEAAIYTGVQVLVRLTAMAAVAIYARAILPAAFGLLDVTLAVQGMLMPLGTLGLTSAIKQFWFEDADPQTASTVSLVVQVIVGAALALVGVMGAPTLSYALTGQTAYTAAFQLAVGALPFFLIQDHAAGMLRIVQQPWRYAGVVTGVAVVQAVLGAVLAVGLGQGVPGILRAGLIAQAVFAALGLWLIRQTLAWRASWPLLREMLAYGLPLVPEALVRWVMNTANRLVFALFGLLGAAGIFGVGYRVGLLVLVVAQAFELAWLPFALSIIHQADAPRLYARSALLYAALAGGIACGVGLFARELTALLAPPEYAAASGVASLVALSNVLGGMMVILGIGARIVRHTWRISLATVIGAAVGLLLTLALVPPLEAVGAAWALVIGQAVSVATLIGLVRHVYTISFPWRRLAALAASMVVMILIGAAWPPDWPRTLSVLFKGGLLLLWPVWLSTIGVIRRDDWQALQRLWQG